MSNFFQVAAFLSVIAPLHAFGDHPEDSLDNEQHHGQHAHVHGEATVTLAQEGNELRIEFNSPAFNLTGFEHEPESDAERAIVNAIAYQLTQLDSLLVLPEQADCKLLSTDVDSVLLDKDHGGHSHELDNDSGFVPHADFTVNYHLQCKATLLLSQVHVTAFKTYRRIEEVDLEWVINDQQGAAIATPDKPFITIK